MLIPLILSVPGFDYRLWLSYMSLCKLYKNDSNAKECLWYLLLTEKHTGERLGSLKICEANPTCWELMAIEC